ncbi:MAG: GNAT family N-acetyltransferase [Bacteroidetes bacterium]|nr:MAG: GNAT family N-acetyltransferase [Bacteroidota bacterium]
MTQLSKNMLSVREFQERDIDSIVQYWLGSDKDHLIGMGVDLDKLPTKEAITEMLLEQLQLPVEKKNGYCIIWQADDKPIGHCNTNPTTIGNQAYMHLHLWNNNERKKGIGTELVKMTLPYFFKNLQLRKLYSQPYALNPAAHRTLQKVGFEFVKDYTTIPGSMNFEQPVKLWKLTYEKFKIIE